MKINKDKLARVLAELPDWTGHVKKWDDLIYHQKLTYKAEAERFLRAIRILKKNE